MYSKGYIAWNKIRFIILTTYYICLNWLEDGVDIDSKFCVALYLGLSISEIIFIWIWKFGTLRLVREVAWILEWRLHEQAFVIFLASHANSFDRVAPWELALVCLLVVFEFGVVHLDVVVYFSRHLHSYTHLPLSVELIGELIVFVIYSQRLSHSLILGISPYSRPVHSWFPHIWQLQ